MKYNIYDTKALVLKSVPNGEEGLSVLLMTREFGCLYARAQGARKSFSRLRSGLVDSTLVSVGLLSGKGGWRITYLFPHTNFFFSLRGCPAGQSAVAKMMAVCGRLVGESEGNQKVFDIVSEGFSKMSLEGSDIHDVERSVMLGVLHTQGYIEYSTYSLFVSDEDLLKDGNKNELSLLRRRVTREINRALEVAW